MEEFSREEANENKQKYDRTCKLEAFDESKAGSRALSMRYYTSSSCFRRSPTKPAKCAQASGDSHLRIPITDLEEIAKDPSQCKEVVNEVRSASRTRGLFPVVNNGIPAAVLEEMLDGVRRFHEQGAGEKRPFYPQDFTRSVASFLQQF
ncbi:1-aminocyclopropane-1-carboxylate oxidase homolog [Rhodamnia argentea]|uniref:1-aminocyclopropane-1-carboxylate oxidase homolog n=1 Tax=Rhodamnia argentea TaxID=178133 RepID=A0ABM3HA81_9MYRT|nr:1-aminocyclopropane-1-carboxylate oxidase homolog [Rhodamnia argentea]